MNQVADVLHSLGFDYKVAIANLVNFLVIFFVLKKYFFPSIKETLDNRKQKIEQGIEDAKNAESLLNEAESIKKSKIIEAQIASDEILQKAHLKAISVSEKTILEAEEESKKIISLAHKREGEIRVKTEEEIKSYIPTLVVSLSEKILKEKMSPSENENYIKRILPH